MTFNARLLNLSGKIVFFTDAKFSYGDGGVRFMILYGYKFVIRLVNKFVSVSYVCIKMSYGLAMPFSKRLVHLNSNETKN